MINDLEVGCRAVVALRLRYTDRDGAGNQHLALNSPGAASAYAFDQVPPLSRRERLLVIGLRGFDRSGRRINPLSPVAISEVNGGFLTGSAGITRV